MMTYAQQRQSDEAEKLYRVEMTRYTKAGQWTYFTANPYGGGFGMNTSDASLTRGIARATVNLKPGTRYRLVVNGTDRGVFTKEEGR